MLFRSILETALTQDQKTRLKDWFADPNQFEQPSWYYTRTEQIQAAQAQIELAKTTLSDAEANLAKIIQSPSQVDFLNAEKRLLDARQAYLITKDVNNRAQNSATVNVPKGIFNLTHCGTNKGYFVINARITNQLYKCTGDQHLGDVGRTLFQDAQDELESAQKAYNSLLNSDSSDLILQARAEVSVAQERYHSALDYLRSLQTGEEIGRAHV